MASIAIIAAKELQRENTNLKQKLHLTKSDFKTENKELKQQVKTQNECLAQLEKLVTTLASGNSLLPEKGKFVVFN